MCKKCLNCEKILNDDQKQNIFCSRSCAAIVNNKKHPKRIKIPPKNNCPECGSLIENRHSKYCCNHCYQIARKQISIDRLEKGQLLDSKTIRTHIFSIKEKRCESCLSDTWMGKPISLEVHHIDANPHNHKFDNLQILCSNCHSATDSYRAKNVGNGRKKRYKK